MIRTLAAVTVLSLMGLAGAQNSSLSPATTEQCGAYTVKVQEGRVMGDPGRISLMLNGKALVTLEDAHIGLDFCRDITGDGVPEAMLMQHSGGAHCCATHHLYSLTRPLRRILHARSGHSLELTVKQLDGKGPMELIGDDWRFAYAYGLSFAGSPALPVVYADRDGRYVEDTRSFPGLVLGRTVRSRGEVYAGDSLHDYAALLLVGKPGQADAFLRGLPAPHRTWLENYGPDIRQNMRDAGMTDWPERAGVTEEQPYVGIGGAFTAAGQREFLAIVGEKNGPPFLRLYQTRTSKITSSPRLLSVPDAEATDGLLWWPTFTVRRGSGRDDAVITDRRSGSVRYPVYRVTAQSSSELKEDALAVASRLMADLSSLALHVQALSDTSPRTAAQRAELTRRVEAAVQRAQPWMDRTSLDFALARLGVFTVQAIEMSRDLTTAATVVAPVELGLTDGSQTQEYVPTQRYTLSITLHKGAGGWTVQNWRLSERRGDPPNP